ncbi:hypothetical protein CAC42_8032 [Sphaceloma murrayae]|uniref:DUF7053 domain-containing protein n=1 Tax=Sphaceloma murrayae TaxID=2082308 RepID=A0A2K1QR95_9PEZI|nr:hypothetical protein CAC42_8032 [Sphaceloma murrayae]
MFEAVLNYLSQRSQFTKVTPLPPSVTRTQAVELLHNHAEIIQLNPLIIDFKSIPKPDEGPDDESHYTWYELTDKITYLPGYARNVTYRGAFLDTPEGVNTHVYAPAGLEIRERWYICDSSQVRSSSCSNSVASENTDETSVHGNGGLVLCEDIDMTCNVLLVAFVKKQLMASHAVLTERLLSK